MRPHLRKQLRHAMWLHLQPMIGRHLASHAGCSWSSASKANAHEELCKFYVAVYRGIDPDRVRRYHEDAYQAVHAATQALTDHLNEEIGFPLMGKPDYDRLEPAFFERFHELATQQLRRRGSRDRQLRPWRSGRASGASSPATPPTRT